MGVFGAIGGALISSSAARKAAKSQEAAANRDIAYQQETRDLIRSDLAPFRQGGTLAQQAYMSELGLGTAPAGYGGFTKTPGYDFRMNEGINALEAGAAARGGLYSGSAMKALNKFGQDYGSNEYGNFMSRLGGMVDTGMSAAQMSGNASQNAAAGVSNALSGIGNAQAAGRIGSANAINSGIQNALGVWNYQNQLGGGGGQNWTGVNSNSGMFNGLFGGRGLGGFV